MIPYCKFPTRLLRVFTLLMLLFTTGRVAAQFIDKTGYVLSKEGKVLWERQALIQQCLRHFKTDEDNQEAMQVCNCRVNLMDRHFSLQEIKKYEKQYPGDAINRLIASDSGFQKQLQDCYSNATKKNVFFSPTQVTSYRDSMIAFMRSSSKEPLDESKLGAYCNCAVGIMSQRKVNEETLHDMSDPNSMLYNEIAYRCGGYPYKKVSPTHSWRAADSADVHGNLSIDSIDVITVMGMTKLKVKIGPVVKIWMLDCGATDMMVSDSMINKLIQLQLVSPNDYLGKQTYEMADGRKIVCDVYKINHVQVGHFTVDNLVICASKEADMFLVGKTLLNKFRHWTIDNQAERLILEK